MLLSVMTSICRYINFVNQTSIPHFYNFPMFCESGQLILRLLPKCFTYFADNLFARIANRLSVNNLSICLRDGRTEFSIFRSGEAIFRFITRSYMSLQIKNKIIQFSSFVQAVETACDVFQLAKCLYISMWPQIRKWWWTETKTVYFFSHIFI